MGQVVTELVVDADTSGADQFTQSMGNAKAAADSSTSSAASMSLAIAGVGVAFVGGLTALRGFVDYVGGVNQQLVSMADSANLAGMSTKEFQETLFAAKSTGVSDKDFVSGLDKIGADLTAASRGVTDFGKLFEANGVSIKDTNGQLITTKQALNDIAGLMLNATPQVQAAIAKIVGLSSDWIPFLKQGEDAIDAQKDAAASLGVVIDDSVIQKARDFNTQWQTAIATWDLQFKASLADILPLLIQLANIASSVISGVGQISGFFGRSLTPVDQMGSSDLNKQADAVADLTDKVTSLGSALREFQKFKIQNAKGALGLPEDADLATLDAYQDKLQDMAEQKAAPTRVAVTGGTTVLPPTGSDANDAVDNAINALQKHTQTVLADAQAVGLGDAALAQFRGEAAETAAVLKNGGKETDAQSDAFQDLQEKAAAAADALAKAKVAGQISFNGQTSLLSPTDVAIATQLKGIYGNDIPAALASSEAAALRFDSAVKETSSGIQNDLVSGLTDITMGTTSASLGFQNMGLAILKTIDQMIIKFAIVNPLAAALQSSLGGGSSILGLLGIGGFSGAVNANGSIAGAVGATSVGGAPLVGLHAGGIVGSEATFTRYVHPAYFDDAPKFHTGGIAGDEVPIIAKKGEGVFTQGQMAAMGGGGTTNNFYYQPSIDASGADSTAVAKLATVIASDKQTFDVRVTALIQKTARNKPGSF